MLALRASTSLARARCVPDRGEPRRRHLVVVPKAETDGEDLSRRLVPSNEILRYVKRYLDERRLVGTLLTVVKPTLRRAVAARSRCSAAPSASPTGMRREIEERLRRYLHPLVGGRDGEGWPFGRAGAQDRAHPPGRGGPRGRGGRLGRHARRGQAASTSSRSGSTPTSCPTWSTSTSSRRSATRSCDGPWPMVMVTELHSRRVVRVPDLVGQPLTKARLVVENAGLAVDAVLFRESYEDHDTVLEQSPARGQMVYEGSRVTPARGPARLHGAPAGDLPPLRRGRPQHRPRHLLRLRAPVRLDRGDPRPRLHLLRPARVPAASSSPGWRRGPRWCSTTTGRSRRSARCSSARSTSTASAAPRAACRCSSSCSSAASR